MDSHSRVFCVTLLWAAAFLSLTVHPAWAQSLIIADYAWTSGVKNLQPVDDLGAVISPQPVYLWLRIEADASALKALESKGKLPISCRWIRYFGTQSEGESRELIDEIKLGVGASDLAPRLRNELTKKGCFDWRTWSMKNRAYSGDWIVEVVFSDRERTPLLCRPSGGGDPVPCGFTITVE